MGDKRPISKRGEECHPLRWEESWKEVLSERAKKLKIFM